MHNIDLYYIGYICEVLDNNQAKYHHCHTWFKLFLENNIYAITAIKNNAENRVVVYKGDNISWCINTKAPIVFEGTLQDFENWLQSSR